MALSFQSLTNCPICGAKLPPERPLLLCPAGAKQPWKPLRADTEVGVRGVHTIDYDKGVYQ
jgi:hypothetical protein